MTLSTQYGLRGPVLVLGLGLGVVDIANLESCTHASAVQLSLAQDYVHTATSYLAHIVEFSIQSEFGLLYIFAYGSQLLNCIGHKCLRLRMLRACGIV